MRTTRKYEDTRAAYAPLADGETYLAPGQTEPLRTLVERGRMVSVPLGRIEKNR